MTSEAPLSAVTASPTFDNLDMILPSQNPARDTPSPPLTNSSPNLGRMSSFNTGKRRTALDKPGLGPRLPIAGTSRPSMPGSWQSESDFNDPGSLTRKTSLSQSQSPAFGKRMSRTGSLRAAAGWQRTPSPGKLENGHHSQLSLLGPGTRRPTLAERLEEEDPPDSPYTTTSESNAEEDDDDGEDIGSKAEEILANAKKRLTAMEGNLNRARSLSITRTSSPASSSSDVQPRYSKRISSASNMPQGKSWALASSKLRQASLTGGSGHLRVFSETAASTKRTSTSSPQRSMSALGYGSSPGSARRTDWTDGSSSDSYMTGQSRYLDTLREDEMYTDDLASQPSQPSPLPHQVSNASMFYHTPTSSTSTLSRARSSIALRDLQEGVGDLKDKVDQLKQRTKRDSMRRASLQKIKTTSPFNNADSWADPRDRESKVSTISTETAFKITEPTPPQDQGEFATSASGFHNNEPLSAASSASVYSNADYKSPVSHLQAQHQSSFADSPLLPEQPRIRQIPPTPTYPHGVRHTQNHSVDSSRTTDTVQSSDTITSEPISPSLSDAFPIPPDKTPTPPRSRSNSAARSTRSRSSSSASHTAQQSLSHEDNPDAFDYSRFLLDSAMGAYTLDEPKRGSHSRSPSASSTGTQSTTRPGKTGTARLSKMSNVSAASRASTAKRVSVSPKRRSRESGSGTQRRTTGKTNSGYSVYSVNSPEKVRSDSPDSVRDATSPPTTSPHGKVGGARPGHARQLSTDSISASSVASFATALERASSQLTIRSMSRSTLRNASAGSTSGPIPTHRAGLEAYNSNWNASFVSAVTTQSPHDEMHSLGRIVSPRDGDQHDFLMSPVSPPPIGNGSGSGSGIISATVANMAAKRDTQNQLNDLLINEADALRTPTSPGVISLPSNISKASAAILSAIMAVSHAAVREDDERLGISPNIDKPRMMHQDDEALIGRIIEGVLAAAVGLIGRPSDSATPDLSALGGEFADGIDHGSKGNSWRDSSKPEVNAGESKEVNQQAVEQQRQIIRLRCEVARRALTEDKPGDGF